jgi:hypothetical protein
VERAWQEIEVSLHVCPLVKPVFRPRFEPETSRKKVTNLTDLFGDEQF